MAELAMLATWLTDSGRFNHKVVTHPAISLAQDRENSPAETSVLPTMLRRQHHCYTQVNTGILVTQNILGHRSSVSRQII